MRMCDLQAPLLFASVLIVGCTSEPPSRRAAESPAGTELTAASATSLPRSLDLPDSLLFRLASGTEVWWTIARESADSSGATCVERGLELRRDADTVAVPLLYSVEPPEPVNDTTLRARLWTSCAPGRVYHVDLRTGQPTPAPAEEPAG
jgi:hypothetical protein